MLYKTLEFKNVGGQMVKVTEIPVLEKNNHYYFKVHVRLQDFVSSIYNQPEEKNCYSFREYLKRKMRWPDYKELFYIQQVKDNA
ncbi:DUF2535 family protein [Peribacillus glennii]|uniref:DUF2535 family protein n=1 Tax=Peribacillus glennii TaxID=2303991 RepID=A0A372LJM1_9BACI|nr:DUF2535 family protein [Peribacillus glennii]RFU66638.1 DUF2535 family protein [Peribacillus glennii]